MRETRELIRAWRQARHVVVVCYGNVCRSPFATKYLQGKRPVISGSGRMLPLYKKMTGCARKGKCLTVRGNVRVLDA